MKIFSSHNQKGGEQGFTLVEVLISLTIFSIAVTGVISVAAQGGLSVDTAKNKITASYLADEGLELMRAFRDKRVIGYPIGSETLGWDAFISSTAGCVGSTPCDIDGTNSVGSPSVLFPDGANLTTCPSTGCPLYYNPTDGYYYNIWGFGGTPPQSRFKRRTTVVESPSGNEATITVVVTWNQGTVPQSITVSERVFNWYNPLP